MFNAKKCEFGYFQDTVYRWYSEGLPIGYENIKNYKNLSPEPCIPGGWGPVNVKLEPQDEDVAKYFDFNLKSAAVPNNFAPFKKQKTLEETEDYRIFIDQFGIKQKKLKKSATMPHFLDYPVKNRDDFEEIKSLYSNNYEERLNDNWESEVEEYRKEGYIIWLYNHYWGFFGILRQLMGIEKLSLMFYDDPDFIRYILRFYSDYVLGYWDYILKKIEVDYVMIWEDMAYRQDSLISLEMFREFLLPHYKEITSFLRGTNIKKIFVDSDGNINNLIPLWIEGGIDGVYPMEVQSGMDITEVRKRFPDLIICGGIDKKALAKTKKDIDYELEKAEYVLKTGNYLPFVDHGIPVDVSWENFKYYRSRLNKLIDKYNPKK